KIEFRRRDFNIALHTEITVATVENVEVRRVTISNLSPKKRYLEVTSYGEAVLNSYRADKAHPAFSKMFIETQLLPHYDTLLLSRRPRSHSEENFYVFHSVSMKTVWDRVQYESSRAQFLGRGNSVARADALSGKVLSGTVGFVLDPVFSLRVRVELEPNK